MGATCYRFPEISLEEHWKAKLANDSRVVMFSSLKHSGQGSGQRNNLDVDWHGWAILHHAHGFYCRVVIFTRAAYFPAPHLSVIEDGQREVEVREYSEVEGPYCFTMPHDMFDALCDMPFPADFSASDIAGCNKFREMHKKHS